jgi:predicted DNA-binding transcriptional regulator YafY
MAQKSLQNAIHAKAVVTFTYEGTPRTVEPYMLGLSTYGNITLVGWQKSGAAGEGFQSYLIDKIRSALITEDAFETPRVNFNPSEFGMKHVLAKV